MLMAQARAAASSELAMAMLSEASASTPGSAVAFMLDEEDGGFAVGSMRGHSMLN